MVEATDFACNGLKLWFLQLTCLPAKFVKGKKWIVDVFCLISKEDHMSFLHQLGEKKLCRFNDNDQMMVFFTF